MQPVLLLAGGWVTGSQVFVVRHLESAIKKPANAELADLNVKWFIAAAQAAFLPWVRPLIVIRFLLTTVGSLAILVALAVMG